VLFGELKSGGEFGGFFEFKFKTICFLFSLEVLEAFLVVGFSIGFRFLAKMGGSWVALTYFLNICKVHCCILSIQPQLVPKNFARTKN
jgi:hypothetical protein